MTTTDLLNLLQSITRNFKVPYECWMNQKPPYHKLKPFGCLSLSLIPEERRKSKFEPVSENGVVLGYSNNFSTYRILKLNSRRVIQSCHVKFNEKVFPGCKDAANDVGFNVEDMLKDSQKQLISQLMFNMKIQWCPNTYQKIQLIVTLVWTIF